MMKTDLETAGIPYKVDGTFADFHSLRHSTASLLIQTGASPKVVQALMRHTDLNLTMSKYTHLYAGQQRQTIENLPDFIVHQDKAAKTGTDDCIAENQSKIYCPKTANQSENLRTIPNNSSGAITLRNSGFGLLNRKETPFSGNECRPAFSAEKSGRQDSNLRPENHKELLNNDLQENQKAVLPKNCPQDNVSPDLQQIISAWPELPEHIKQAIKALVQTNSTEQK